MNLWRFTCVSVHFAVAFLLSMGAYAEDDNRQKVADWIKAGSPIARGEMEDLFLSVHKKLTPNERVKAIGLLENPDRFVLEELYESEYDTTEKSDLLGELNDREMEFGVEELIVEVAGELAKTDLNHARKWLSGFSRADYARGNGLTAILQVAFDQAPANCLAMLRDLTDTEAEALIGSGELPDFQMPAREWKAEVERFQSLRLKNFLLDWPIVFRFARESPQSALDYINDLSPEKRNGQQGRQVVWSLLRDDKYSPSDVLAWIENRIPMEARADELYGQLAANWSRKNAESFQEWFAKLESGSRRDAVILGFAGHDGTANWKKAYELAGTIADPTKRQTKVAWVLGAWQRTDPLAAEAMLQDADITDEMRRHLTRTIEARKQQLGRESKEH